MSYATPEGRIVKKCLDYANALPRTTAHKVHGNQFSAGEPDLDIVCYGRACKFEVKTGGTEAAIRKRVTPLQRSMLREYERAGAIVGVITSVDELAAMLFDAKLISEPGEGTVISIRDILATIKRVKARLD